MIRRLIAQGFIWFIIIGSIAYGVAWLLGDPTPTILSQYTINYGNGVSITMYRLDIHAYIANLENSIQIPFKNMAVSFPMPYNATGWDAVNLPKILYNAVIWAINFFGFLNNYLLLIPTKLLIHPLILILSLLGINTTGLGIVKVANMIYSFTIPFIPYW